MIECAFDGTVAVVIGLVLFFVFFLMHDNAPSVGGSVPPHPILHDRAMKGNQVIFNLLHGYAPLSTSGLLSYRLSS